MCWSAHRYGEFDEPRERRHEPETFDAGLRVSDADRERVIAQLRKHTGDGRLTLDEFAERVGEAWAATTHGDLGSVLRDLPVLDNRPQPQPRPRRARTGIPVPLLVIALVAVGSLLMSHFAWWLIPVGFFAFGGCGGRADRNRRDEPRATTREDSLISA